MPWPPTGVPLPISRTDATNQQATHPDDHNKANGAINDIVTRVQAIDTRTTNVGVVVQGVCSGVSIPPAGELQVATITLPDGCWVVNYNVQITSISVFNATVKMLNGITPARVHTIVCAAKNAANPAAAPYAVTTLARGPVTVNVAIGAPYAADPLTVYADSGNHQLFAVGTVAF